MHTDFGYFEEDALGKPYDIRLMKRLYPYTKPYRRLLFSSIFLVIFITVFDLSIPYVTKIAIDRYIVPVNGLRTVPSSGGSGKIRYYTVRMENEEIRRTVSAYPNIFHVEGNLARISFDDLAAVKKPDLTKLRRKDFSGLSIMAVLFVGLILANFAFTFAQVMIMELTGQRIMHDLRTSLFRHIQSLSVSYFNHNPVGRLVTRVTNDVQNMHELFTSVISFLFKDLFLLLGIACVLISINWQLALVSFTVLPIVAYASFSFATRARGVFRVIRIKIAEINIKISETISGIKVIQLFNKETENYRSFKILNHEYYIAGMNQIRLFALFMPFIEFMGVIALAIVIYYGGGGVIAERVSLGALVAFISYMRMFFRPIRDIAEKYNILQNAMASAERIFLVLDNEDKLPVPVTPGKRKTASLDRIADVAMENVSFAYVADEPILKNISFDLNARETLAIVGPTGSGKTTLINLITRFYDPTSGTVSVNGHDIKGLSPSIVRSKMALVMQDPFLFSGTIRDNIFQGSNHISKEQIDNILAASRCQSLIDKLPDGLDTILTEGAVAISSGERQLVSIARAMAREPDLIILDEATSYIDSETEHKIQDALSNLLRHRTGIIVAHRLSTVRYADRIMVLNRGRVIEMGTHRQLMEKNGFYYRLNQLPH